MTSHIIYPSWLDNAIEFCINKTRRNLATLYSYLEQIEEEQCGKTNLEQYGGRLNGHWVGLLWLIYAITDDPLLAMAARDWSNHLLPLLNSQTDHEFGSLFELGFVLGYQLTGDESLKHSALKAAARLGHNFNIQDLSAFDISPESHGRTIMSIMMNLDLLFWAGKETDDSYYAEIAATHARTTLSYHVQHNENTRHLCDFDPEASVLLQQDSIQGMRPISCWSCDQVWGIYGFANCYRATGDPVYLNASRRLMVYLWPRLPADFIPFWNFESPFNSTDVRDSSSAAALASGLLSLSAIENDPTLANIWQNRAVSILESLWQTYTNRDANDASLLLHSTGTKPNNLMAHDQIHGDYYFVEALLRLAKPILLL